MAALGPVSEWLASKLDGFDTKGEHVTCEKSPAKAILNATGDPACWLSCPARSR